MTKTELIVPPTRQPIRREDPEQVTYVTRSAPSAMEAASELQAVMRRQDRTTNLGLWFAGGMAALTFIIAVIAIAGVLWSSHAAMTEVSEVAHHALDTAESMSESMAEAAKSEPPAVHVEDNDSGYIGTAFVVLLVVCALLAFKKGFENVGP